MNIVLLGYMGCGKSSIGKDLASQLKIEYLDLDEYLEYKERKTIKEIFEDQGEIYFRKKESEYLKELLDLYKDTVISLGGGTPCFANNMTLITEHVGAKSVYLKASLDELVLRLFSEKEHRPLIAHIKTKAVLEDFIRKHMFERSFYYNQAEQLILTDHKSISTITDEIKTALF